MHVVSIFLEKRLLIIFIGDSWMQHVTLLKWLVGLILAIKNFNINHVVIYKKCYIRKDLTGITVLFPKNVEVVVLKQMRVG